MPNGLGCLFYAVFGKPCQVLFIVSIIRIHYVLSRLYVIIFFEMPKKLKYGLKPLDYNSSSIGKRIATLRKKKGFTQKELGLKIGITQTLVSDYETGRSHLSDSMLIRFSLSLNTTPNEILGFKIENKTNHNTHSLKLIKRLNRIEKLPLSKQKALLQIIDGYLDSVGV